LVGSVLTVIGCVVGKTVLDLLDLWRARSSRGGQPRP